MSSLNHVASEHNGDGETFEKLNYATFESRTVTWTSPSMFARLVASIQRALSSGPRWPTIAPNAPIALPAPVQYSSDEITYARREVMEVTDSRAAEAQAPESSTTGRSQGGFRAHLQGIGLHDLVTLQNLVKASGVFVVLSGDRTGTLHFARGQLVHAETADLIGDAAALELLSWREGEFINSERTTPERSTVMGTLDSLLSKLSKDDEVRTSEPPLTSATGVRRRVDGAGPSPASFRTTHQGLGNPSPAPARGLAAAATPGMAAGAPKAPTRAGEARPGVTNVLVSPHGAVLDGNGIDPDTLGSKVAYMSRLTELISQAMGSGDPRSVRVRNTSSELTMRRHADGHVSASLGPADPASEGAPPSSSPPSVRFP
jgi:uncharacterized protein DUF4388